MADEAEVKNNSSKKLIAAIAGAVVVIAAVVGTVILINNNNKNSNTGQSEVLNDDYFKTDDKKIVMSTSSDSTDPTVAKKVHQVYFVDGDKVTGLKVYSEFESEQAAKDADAKPEVEEAMKSGNYKDHKVEGKYIIVTMADSTYQSVTAEQLRMTAAALESAIQNGVNQQTQAQSSSQTTTEAAKPSEQTTTEATTKTIEISSEEE
ncbi:hypothetical protein IKG73_02250 [Candidatus Saccharibacteria bacterium]|nr:hypothetical protein [Candidatus Saccharibacteria bacterium]